jgi:hypothetical protein
MKGLWERARGRLEKEIVIRKALLLVETTTLPVKTG